MEARTKPRIELAKKTLPTGLFETIHLLTTKQLRGCALMGGTALSGFYTAHRQSDDIDLFTESEISFKNAIATVKGLPKLLSKFKILEEKTTAHYYHANCKYKDHYFTIDVVLDPHLFEIAQFHNLSDSMKIASLDTLLKMKIASLVSRCSEKDLSDLKKLFEVFPDFNIKKLIELGKEVDGGVHAESMLASLAGSELHEQACNFSLMGEDKNQIYKELSLFKQDLIQSLRNYLKKQPDPPIGRLIKQAKKN